MRPASGRRSGRRSADRRSVTRARRPTSRWPWVPRNHWRSHSSGALDSGSTIHSGGGRRIREGSYLRTITVTPRLHNKFSATSRRTAGLVGRLWPSQPDVVGATGYGMCNPVRPRQPISTRMTPTVMKPMPMSAFRVSGSFQITRESRQTSATPQAAHSP